MKLDYPEIKDWCITVDNSPEMAYVAPEMRPRRVHGKVYGNEKFEDGTFINTSTIQNIIFEQEVLVVKTNNSTYLLYPQEINVEYDEAYGGEVFNKIISTLM